MRECIIRIHTVVSERVSGVTCRSFLSLPLSCFDRVSPAYTLVTERDMATNNTEDKDVEVRCVVNCVTHIITIYPGVKAREERKKRV